MITVRRAPDTPCSTSCRKQALTHTQCPEPHHVGEPLPAVQRGTIGRFVECLDELQQRCAGSNGRGQGEHAAGLAASRESAGTLRVHVQGERALCSACKSCTCSGFDRAHQARAGTRVHSGCTHSCIDRACNRTLRKVARGYDVTTSSLVNRFSRPLVTPSPHPDL